MKGIIQLQYRKTFDKNVQKVWDSYIFEDTFLEYRMKCQEFADSVENLSFKELLRQNPKAEKLHYLVSLATLSHLNWLENKMPDILCLGERCVPFEQFRFNIIQSHFEDKNKHKVQIDFFSKPLFWIDTLADKLLLATEKPAFDQAQSTFLIALEPNLSLISYQNL